jgi:hypothetical protein
MKKNKHKYDKYEEIDKDYSTRTRDLNLSIPSNFRMLCALFEIKPAKILTDFMWTVSFMMTKATDQQRQAAVEYLIHCGYGIDLYSEDEIRQIFDELNAKRLLWPEINDEIITSEQRDLHYTWSHMYMQYWFEKWYWRVRKKGDTKNLKDY